MIILHCVEETIWEKEKQYQLYGRGSIEKFGFIHCSSIKNFWRVAPHFLDVKEKFLLLCIDTDKVISEIKWEDHNNCGRSYPHIYGELNIDSVINSFPFMINKAGNFELNKEIEDYL